MLWLGKPPSLMHPNEDPVKYASAGKCQVSGCPGGNAVSPSLTAENRAWLWKYSFAPLLFKPQVLEANLFEFAPKEERNTSARICLGQLFSDMLKSFQA